MTNWRLIGSLLLQDQARQSGSNAWLSIPVIAFGAALLAFVLVQGWRGVASRRWSTTKGRVLESKVRTVSFKHIRYMPEVKYEYWVDETRYQGRRIGFAQPTYPLEDEAWQVADRYPVEAEVTVRYSPSDPSEAVLEAGPRSWFMLCGATLLGVVLLAIGAWLAQR